MQSVPDLGCIEPWSQITCPPYAHRTLQEIPQRLNEGPS